MTVGQKPTFKIAAASGPRSGVGSSAVLGGSFPKRCLSDNEPSPRKRVAWPETVRQRRRSLFPFRAATPWRSLLSRRDRLLAGYVLDNVAYAMLDPIIPPTVLTIKS